MSNSTKPSAATFASTILAGFSTAMACFSVFVGLVFLSPLAGPAVWVGVVVALFVGMNTIHRRLPDYSFPVGVVFVPVVGGLLVLLALQVYWTLLGARL